jgi:NAD(P)-dependent dehydrogenase (short-subunit alcohol dehydrogenase family)
VRIFELCQSVPPRFGGQEATLSDPARVWLVTGVSTGFGRELAKLLLQQGDTVVGTLRQEGLRAEFEALEPGRAYARVLDVTDAPAIAPLVDGIVREFGRIDVLVNNAGFGLLGAVEELDDTQARRVIETNYFGTLNMIRAVLPHFRARRRGHIVNISSSAGFMGMPGVALYCASKFAVTGLSEALAGELAPFGIHVTVVQPGGFRTDFSGRSLSLPKEFMPEYDDTPAARVRGMKAYHGTQQGDPAKAARVIIEAVDAERPPVHLVLGPDAVAMQRGHLLELTQELAAWEAASSSTDFDQKKEAS